MAKRKWMVGTIAVIVILAIAGLAIWRWAMANQSVATLDRIDRFFDEGAAMLETGPVSYGDADAQRLFVWRPVESTDERKPVIVFIHGGGWNSGTPGDYAFMGRNLAPEGYVVVNVGYRLNDTGKFPAMLEDSADAVKWVHDNIAEFGGDPESIYLMGHSAGAYNAVMLALDRQWLGRKGLPDNTIKAAIGLAGPYDFLPLDSASTKAAFGDWNRLEATQPINFARGDAPPLLLATGSADTTVKPRNSIALAKALSEAGAPTEPVVIEGLSHERLIMNFARPFSRETRARDAVLEFLNRVQSERAQSNDISVPVQAQTG